MTRGRTITTPRTRLLDPMTIEDLAIGSAVLGTGGGGDPYIGKLIARQAVEERGPVDIIQPDELVNDDLDIVVSMSGAPTVMSEKIPNGGEMERVAERAVDFAGKPPRAVLSFENGGINSTFPVAAAARMRITLVDADGMGRAVPEFQITAFNAGGVTFGPRFVIDEKGNVLRIDGIDASWLERINRRALVAMGGSVMSAIGPTGADVRNASIHGSISLAVTIGAAIRRAHEQKLDWREELHRVTISLVLFGGKVVSVERRAEGGWVRGHALMAGLGCECDRRVRIDFQNEHLLAREGIDGEFPDILASTPDLIAVLDTDTGIPITTEGLRYGQRATLIGIKCQPIWRSPRGLDLAGPRYFRWPIDYIPIEERFAQRAARAWRRYSGIGDGPDPHPLEVPRSDGGA